MGDFCKTRYFCNFSDSFSDNDSCKDFETYDAYVDKADTCEPKRCQMRTGLEDAIINMKVRLGNTKSKKDKEPENQVQLSPAPNLFSPECCSRKNGKKKGRKFVCNFSSLSAKLGNECLEMERARCQGFWKLVDSRPELLALIRQGEFEHVNAPKILEPKTKKIPQRCQDAEILRARNKALHEEAAARRDKRKQVLEQLKIKSGLTTLSQERASIVQQTARLMEVQRSEELKTNFAKVFEEMNAFDEKVGNAVRTKYNPPSYNSNIEDEEGESFLSLDEEEEMLSPSSSLWFDAVSSEEEMFVSEYPQSTAVDEGQESSAMSLDDVSSATTRDDDVEEETSGESKSVLAA